MEGQTRRPEWTFLTNHAQVLVCISEQPNIRGRDIAAAVGITERAAQSIISDLVECGYVARFREGRRNRYAVNRQGQLRHPLQANHTIGELLSALGALQPARSSSRSRS
jgi:hypothetical protein